MHRPALELMMSPARARHSSQPRQTVPATAVAILKEGTRLVITEGRLLRTELAEKVGVVGIGLVLTVGGALLLMMALIALFVVAIGALVEAGFSLTVAARIVFAALLVLG